MWWNMQDGTNCRLLCSSRSNTWGLFSVQPPRIQHPELIYYSGESQKTRKAPTLQMLHLAASCKKPSPAKTNKCIFCMRRTQCCIIKTKKRQDYTENCTIYKQNIYGSRSHLHAESLCAASRPVAFTALWLWCIFMIIENNYCSNVFIYEIKPSLQKLKHRCRLYMLGSIHYLTLL